MTKDRRGTSTYKLKREYTGIASHRLNPLYRYTFERHTKPSFLFKNWFTNEDVESDMGTFPEACWSCHAIQKESCFHCNSRNSLRWSGGFGSSWQDLVCVECRCMYELKTKASMEKIESTYYHNNLNSGSFYAYCQIERVIGTKLTVVGGQKCFLSFFQENLCST